MKKKTLILSTLLFFALGVCAQTIWSPTHLQEVKASLDKPAYSLAYEQLLNDAGKELNKPALSVMMKEKTPASGDKHDYMSQARYYWPDPTKQDGLPYIVRDGESNPELEKLDRVRLGQMANSVTTLALAWYFSGEEKYAQKATELIRVWFFHKDTRMNPNLNYAQMIPGHNEGKGRCYGVIDTYSFVEMLDAVQLLEKSKSFTTKDSKQLKEWFGKLLNWILTSEQGQEESRQKNNHSVAHDAQAIAFALYAGNKAVAERIINEFPEKRIFKQIEPDGKQPYELRRTLAFGYSEYNVSHMIDIFLMAQKIGISLDNATSADGRNFYKALDFLVPYLGKEVSAWPYQQISEWEYKQSELGKDIYKTYLLNPARTDYLQVYRENRVVNWKDRFHLLYLKADEVDNAFAFVTTQLNYAFQCVDQAKKENPNKRLVSPRTVEKDGSLRLVAPRDWCSGFFPGSLWHTYAYTNDNYWRQEAISYTWPIEEMKRFKGTHDLGFVIFNSFGQAYRLTGEKSYKDVVLQAANSLITRYSEKVKAIRSWDWSRDWKYPVIIDNMLNLEMLFWASEETGNPVYKEVAINHANTTLKNHFRPDYSSYHVIDYDPETGEVLAKHTHQGIHHESVWSRGQGWGLYGFTMCYRFTKDPAYLAQAEKIADFFFSQFNMPEDLIAYWDMKDPAIPNAPRDASAAALMASALYELAGYTSTQKSTHYKELADTLVHNLTTHYQAEPGTTQGFLLLHSTGNYPKKDEIDAPISYADYYYLEALLRKAGITNYKK
ncbi:glycosyl hydrolase family 88 [Parabacteroides sp. 52]|uniref:alginate lyase family protein n=1 Tax=unclassified Parabacteroides TaxID=2649774 RepID=UPI0013D5EA04|nr:MULTISPECIES: alginate lyase family protein [unclassified Parabacteroides]MDH6534647.1 unsaturated chondroitin disaccharide hydrolase [Parabacteroides sp. PM5-20]NDV56114.1 glycosyl hydrolase family 88 [Parabacteroides sp. 52]